MVDKKVEEINELIEISFGKRYKANYFGKNYSLGNYSYLDGGCYKPRNQLGYILKKGLLTSILGKPIGQLGAHGVPDSDGSVIVILPEFESKAIKYAELYEKKIGKKVKVIVNESLINFNYCNDHIFRQSSNLEKEVETIKPTDIKPAQTDFINPWELDIPEIKEVIKYGI